MGVRGWATWAADDWRRRTRQASGAASSPSRSTQQTRELEARPGTPARDGDRQRAATRSDQRDGLWSEGGVVVDATSSSPGGGGGGGDEAARAGSCDRCPPTTIFSPALSLPPCSIHVAQVDLVHGRPAAHDRVRPACLPECAALARLALQADVPILARSAQVQAAHVVRSVPSPTSPARPCDTELTSWPSLQARRKVSLLQVRRPSREPGRLVLLLTLTTPRRLAAPLGLPPARPAQARRQRCV